MLKEFAKAVSAIGVLCVTLQSNLDGARYVIALASIATIGCVAYWTLKR
ncbi:hypothetical protein [Paraburkholderia sp. GAS32]